MIDLPAESVQHALATAGIEIYRSRAGEIAIAERIRVHLMDSGIRVVLGATPTVRVTVRSQRSDFPSASRDELFAMVRNAMAPVVVARGFVEIMADERQVTDPVDANHVLDVWHELTYEKGVTHLDGVIDEVRWALGVSKCVAG